VRKSLKLAFFFILVSSLFFSKVQAAGEQNDLLEVDWSFKSFFGKFDRASLQRGYQVYTEVCASCHSLKHLSYRNLAEKGGPELQNLRLKRLPQISK
jgi:ubiquinol-cytochrome c reductase cytochrome c1 subunit